MKPLIYIKLLLCYAFVVVLSSCEKDNYKVGPLSTTTPSLNLHEYKFHPHSRIFKTTIDSVFTAIQQPPTGNFDVDFATAMISYEEGAIRLCDEKLRFTKDPQVNSMAEEIKIQHQETLLQLREWKLRHREMEMGDEKAYQKWEQALSHETARLQRYPRPTGYDEGFLFSMLVYDEAGAELAKVERKWGKDIELKGIAREMESHLAKEAKVLETNINNRF